MPRDVWGPRRCSEIQKYIRMNHFEKKKFRFFPLEGLRKMSGGLARMFPRAPLWLSTGLHVYTAVASRTKNNSNTTVKQQSVET